MVKAERRSDLFTSPLGRSIRRLDDTLTVLSRDALLKTPSALLVSMRIERTYHPPELQRGHVVDLLLKVLEFPVVGAVSEEFFITLSLKP